MQNDVPQGGGANAAAAFDTVSNRTPRGRNFQCEVGRAPVAHGWLGEQMSSVPVYQIQHFEFFEGRRGRRILTILGQTQVKPRKKAATSGPPNRGPCGSSDAKPSAPGSALLRNESGSMWTEGIRRRQGRPPQDPPRNAVGIGGSSAPRGGQALNHSAASSSSPARRGRLRFSHMGHMRSCASRSAPAASRCGWRQFWPPPAPCLRRGFCPPTLSKPAH